MDQPKTFKIQALSRKELAALYDVSGKTFAKWISGIQDLGAYVGKKFTPAQVEKIIKHIGEPN